MIKCGESRRQRQHRMGESGIERSVVVASALSRQSSGCLAVFAEEGDE